MKGLVLDASVAVAWCFGDETAYTESILDLLSHGSEAVVPSMWPVEGANARVSAERRRRITEAKATHFLARLTGFAITMDSPGMARAFQQVLRPLESAA